MAKFVPILFKYEFEDSLGPNPNFTSVNDPGFPGKTDDVFFSSVIKLKVLLGLKSKYVPVRDECDVSNLYL